MKRLLYSWIDVDLVAEQKRAACQWPDWLLSASAYHDGLLLRVRPGSHQPAVDSLLEEWFGPRYVPKQGLLLQGPEAMVRVCPVEVEEGGEQTTLPFRIEPTFRRVSMLPEMPNVTWPKPFRSGTPPVVAFYSFKGGVGRTTNLLAFLASFSARNSGARALIIDADLEAPGISALVEADRTMTPGVFSFTDFLAVAQSDRGTAFGEALDVAAHAVRRQLIQVSGTDHFFLPSHRDEGQFLRLDIRPEHLISSLDHTWSMGDLVAELGARLEAEMVLIDLRAGLSELASPFLFDPRIRKVVVTTPSEQSVNGTVAVLKQLSKFRPPNDEAEFYDPSVVIAFVLPEMIGTEELQSIRLRMLDAYPDLGGEAEPDIGRLRIRETGFSQELLYLSDFSATISKLISSAVPGGMSGLVEEYAPARRPDQPIDASSLQQVRRSLTELAKKLEYAESGQGDRFLSISPLRLLAKQFAEVVPTAVIIGSKGSGKTYTCLQVVRSKAWSSFVALTLRQPQPNDQWGLIWPLLHSKNLEDSAKQLVLEARNNVSTQFALTGPPLNSIQMEDRVHESLQHSAADERWWRIRWFKLIADSMNIESGSENEAPGRVINYLRTSSRRLVVVVDGLEDLFPDVAQRPSQQIALRALLQGVPNYLKEVPNCPLGIVIFVRADLVVSAIPQNVGQFERLYEPFALRWDEEEALRLAVWIAREGGARMDLAENRQLELISAEDARAALVPIWGRKLGPDKSREARTPEWVIAALSDFMGQIQARDLVRFFRHAAEKSIGAAAQDRVLTARAVRDAILPCSEQKIREIKQEIEPLNGIFDVLQRSTDRRIPFDAPKSGLAVDQIQFLIKTGVLIEDQGEYFMPEIFRLGLGFQLASGARPRVLSFARRGRFALKS